ncbi:CBO0543 family protein [Alicyclobacillus acidocaldarius]|uniref:CBO0543 family protein n=1 Tax=Alicyclobacillus acidocaldarius TaxID=405212 RepID=UPI0002E9E494|nr:CBO0543 family protein [Alicyclobacillus acidocaldarius]
MTSFDLMESLRRELTDMTRVYWLEHNLGTWQWWLFVSLAIVPWLVFVRFVDRARLTEVLLYALVVGLVSSVLDIIGSDLMLWGYKVRLLWFVYPTLLCTDMTIIPVTFALIYQACRRWWTFAPVTLVFSILDALMEPVFHCFDIYVSYHWNLLYSIPIYLALASAAKFMLDALTASERRHRLRTSQPDPK